MKQLMVTAKDYEGKKEEDAMIWAKGKGFTVRVVERDGKAEMLSGDVRSDRLNFRIWKGVITEAYGG